MIFSISSRAVRNSLKSPELSRTVRMLYPPVSSIARTRTRYFSSWVCSRLRARLSSSVFSSMMPSYMTISSPTSRSASFAASFFSSRAAFWSRTFAWASFSVSTRASASFTRAEISSFFACRASISLWEMANAEGITLATRESSISTAMMTAMTEIILFLCFIAYTFR